MSNSGPLVIITGAFRFPEGDAAAARVLGIGKALRQLGYEVQFAGWETRGRSEDAELDGVYVYQGFRYFPQNQFRTAPLDPVKRLLRYLVMGLGAVKWIWNLSNSQEIKAIISYHGPVVYLIVLKAFCWVKKIKLIIDCTEWYDAEALPGGRFGLAHIENEIRMRIVNPWLGDIIVISKYLKSYYKSRSCRVVRVPPLVDFEDPKWKINPGIPKADLHLVYAGIPGKKDILWPVIKSIDILKSEGYKISLDLVGPSIGEVCKSEGSDNGSITRTKGQILCHGYVPQSLVPSILCEADFSILFRPQRRSSNAGFSTKLVESLTVGVPVIANKTGDIEIYVRDGIEGILLENESFESVYSGLKRALNLTVERRLQMKAAARTCAQMNFDYKLYYDELLDILERE